MSLHSLLNEFRYEASFKSDTTALCALYLEFLEEVGPAKPEDAAWFRDELLHALFKAIQAASVHSPLSVDTYSVLPGQLVQ